MFISELIEATKEEELDPLLKRLTSTRMRLLEFIISSTGLNIANTFLSGVAIYEDSFIELFWMIGGGFTLTKDGVPVENTNYYIEISPFKIDDKFTYFKLEYQGYKTEIIVSENNKIFSRKECDMFTDNKIKKLSPLSKDKFLEINLE